MTTKQAVSTQGPLVREFIEGFCRHTKGEWAGQLIHLEDWQRELIDDLFEVRDDGLRRYRVGLIGFPRKNGKSTLGSCLALDGLVGEGEPGAEVYSVAGDRAQASIVFDDAKRMVQMDDDLQQYVKPWRYHLEGPQGGVYRVLSSEAKLRQGLNASRVIFDEVHVQPDWELWTAMNLGSGTRRQPLVIGITTAGVVDEDALCYSLYQYGRKVQSGEIDDPTFFFRWWEPSRATCDHTDPEVWHEANPALASGILKLEDFERTCRQMPENDFRRYRLNQWVTQEVAWLPHGAWEACQVGKWRRDAWFDGLDGNLPVHVGIDASRRNDSTAVVIAQMQGDRLVIRSRVWQNPYRPDHPQAALYQVPIFEVETFLREVGARFPVAAGRDERGRPIRGPAFNYDQMYFSRSAIALEAEGLNMVEVPAVDARWVPISATFYRSIVTGQVAHNGDPTLTDHVRNVARMEKPKGWTMNKADKSGKKKTDAAMAAAMAVHSATGWQSEGKKSVYDDREVLIL